MKTLVIVGAMFLVVGLTTGVFPLVFVGGAMVPFGVLYLAFQKIFESITVNS